MILTNDLIPTQTQLLLKQALAQGLCGAALGVVNAAGKRDILFVGQAQIQPQPLPLSPDLHWDLASLSKPLFTAKQILHATEDGLLDLDDPLSLHLPELAWMQDTPLKQRTLRQLLTHTAGLPAWMPLYTWGNAETIRARLLQEPWVIKDAGAVQYSDLGYILLGLVLEKVRQQPLQAFDLPLGLSFLPNKILPAKISAEHCIATEHCAWRNRVLRGETHDENAAALGGVAGHAGLFGTLEGVLNQAELILRGGWLSGAAQALAMQPAAKGRTLAFATAKAHNGGSLCSPNSIGHTGFTGTGFWVDPQHGLAWVLLSNRVHPSRHKSIDIQRLRKAVGNTLLAHNSKD